MSKCDKCLDTKPYVHSNMVIIPVDCTVTLVFILVDCTVKGTMRILTKNKPINQLMVLIPVDCTVTLVFILVAYTVTWF